MTKSILVNYGQIMIILTLYEAAYPMPDLATNIKTESGMTDWHGIASDANYPPLRLQFTERLFLQRSLFKVGCTTSKSSWYVASLAVRGSKTIACLDELFAKSFSNWVLKHGISPFQQTVITKIYCQELRSLDELRLSEPAFRMSSRFHFWSNTPQWYHNGPELHGIIIIKVLASKGVMLLSGQRGDLFQ